MEDPSSASPGTQPTDASEERMQPATDVQADSHANVVGESQPAEEVKGQLEEETKEAPVEVIEITFPLEISYCPVCSFPPGFCEYGPNFELCKKWIAYNCPELYPSLAEELAT